MNFQCDFLSNPIDNLKDQYVLVFDLTSLQDATENCHHPDLVGEPTRLVHNFNFPLEHVTEIIVIEKRKSSVPVDKFGVNGRKRKWIMFLSSKQSTVYCNSRIGTVVHFPLTVFQLLTMTLFPK